VDEKKEERSRAEEKLVVGWNNADAGTGDSGWVVGHVIVSLFGAEAQDSHKVEYEEMGESAERRKERGGGVWAAWEVPWGEASWGDEMRWEGRRRTISVQDSYGLSCMALGAHGPTSAAPPVLTTPSVGMGPCVRQSACVAMELSRASRWSAPTTVRTSAARLQHDMARDAERGRLWGPIGGENALEVRTWICIDV